MKTYRLSRQAEQTLENIFGWTIDHFGIEQANKYKDQLISRLSELAANNLPHGKPCSILLKDKSIADDLEYYREGRHYIIYKNTDYGIWVADFVHSSRNLELIIENLVQMH